MIVTTSEKLDLKVKYEIQQMLKENCEEVYETEVGNKAAFVCYGISDFSKFDMMEFRYGIDKVIESHDDFIHSGKNIKEEKTIININGVEIGGNKVVIIAGPCSVENYKQFRETVSGIKECGSRIIRGGCFKPRTSPYSFQGLRENGMEVITKVKKELGITVISEIMSIEMLDKFNESIDIIQIGAKNMFNYELLSAVGKQRKPVLLKRAMSATIKEFLLSAEYIMKEGNSEVILCERGIRTFEQYTRNTLDLNAIPVLKRLTHLPIVVDPSHAAGHWWMVESLSKAAVAAGADGILVEVHNKPNEALCDGEQSLNIANFRRLVESVKKIAEVEGRSLG